MSQVLLKIVVICFMYYCFNVASCTYIPLFRSSPWCLPSQPPTPNKAIHCYTVGLY